MGDQMRARSSEARLSGPLLASLPQSAVAVLPHQHEEQALRIACLTGPTQRGGIGEVAALWAVSMHPMR